MTDSELFKIVNESRLDTAFNGDYGFMNFHMEPIAYINHIFDEVCNVQQWDKTNRVLAIGNNGHIVVRDHGRVVIT